MIQRHLRREGTTVGGHGVRRLTRKMGIEAIYRRPRTSVANPEHRVVPFPLRGVEVSRRIRCGVRTSPTMDASLCVSALDEALRRGTPEIFDTDQGSQFTSEAFAERVPGAEIRFSTDGRGRYPDVERLWRSLKYEAVHLRELEDGVEARRVNRGLDGLPQRSASALASLEGRTLGEAHRGGGGWRGRQCSFKGTPKSAGQSTERI